MARTANDTRDKLITIGQRLFAEQGVFRVPLRLVIDQAGQRNTSALHYHFGGREGLLAAIIDRHNSGIENERAAAARRHSAPAARRPTFVSSCGPSSYHSPASWTPPTGREFLRVVAQLSDLFDLWDEGPPRHSRARPRRDGDARRSDRHEHSAESVTNG